eukprot:jgi/Phyca11/547877/estExt2_Genewise1Plus.C_PHYCAscaffold_270006
MRTMFGIIKRSQLLSPSTQSLRSQRSEDDVKPRHQEAKEVRRSSASAESENHTNATSDSTTKPGQHFVEEVRDTLEKLLTQLDTVDPRKLLAVRLGGELRGLLGKAEDEFAAYEVEFLEHASNEGVSIALQNFGASLVQVSSIAERLRTAKFLLNRTFKGEVLFAFQEINSYYTSLFMELSMAIARRSGINLPLPPPITPPPAPEPAETPAPTGDEICLEAHQYFFGHGVSKNLTKALQLYTQAADLGCATAMTCLGQMYFAGNGTEKDLLIAGKWFELASSAGEIEACHQLGVLMNGRGGYEPNDMEAATWYSKAADQGHTAAESSLGRLFLIGTHIQHDVAKAIHFLQRAAAKVRANLLCLLYEEGDGCDINYRKAVECYRSAADLNSPHAHFNLGCLLSHGKGVTRNLDAAQAHFRKVLTISPTLITASLPCVIRQLSRPRILVTHSRSNFYLMETMLLLLNETNGKDHKHLLSKNTEVARSTCSTYARVEMAVVKVSSLQNTTGEVPSTYTTRQAT